MVCLLGAIPCRSQHIPSIPFWALGIWEGPVGWEHDTVEYRVRLSLTDSTNVRTLRVLDDKSTFHMVLDSASAERVRFHLIAMSNLTNVNFEDGTIDLLKVDDFGDSLIQAQFYPSGRGELWLGQLLRTKK